jgi:hypothetical protein
MTTAFAPAEDLNDAAIDFARQAGVNLGLKSAAGVVEFALGQNTKGTAAYNELQRVLQLINRLTVAEVEG